MTDSNHRCHGTTGAQQPPMACRQDSQAQQYGQHSQGVTQLSTEPLLTHSHINTSINTQNGVISWLRGNAINIHVHKYTHIRIYIERDDWIWFGMKASALAITELIKLIYIRTVTTKKNEQWWINAKEKRKEIITKYNSYLCSYLTGRQQLLGRKELLVITPLKIFTISERLPSTVQCDRRFGYTEECEDIS